MRTKLNIHAQKIMNLMRAHGTNLQ